MGCGSFFYTGLDFYFSCIVIQVQGEVRTSAYCQDTELKNAGLNQLAAGGTRGEKNKNVVPCGGLPILLK